MRNTGSVHARSRVAKVGLTPAEFIIVFFVLLLLFAAVLTSAGRTNAAIDTVSIKVRDGDTLWSLAQRYPVEGCTTEQTAALLADMNGLQDAMIASGVTLEVPSPASNGSVLAMR